MNASVLLTCSLLLTTVGCCAKSITQQGGCGPDDGCAPQSSLGHNPSVLFEENNPWFDHESEQAPPPPPGAQSHPTTDEPGAASTGHGLSEPSERFAPSYESDGPSLNPPASDLPEPTEVLLDTASGRPASDLPIQP